MYTPSRVPLKSTAEISFKINNLATCKRIHSFHRPYYHYYLFIKSKRIEESRESRLQRPPWASRPNRERPDGPLAPQRIRG
jgi:hypothetical protein